MSEGELGNKHTGIRQKSATQFAGVFGPCGAEILPSSMWISRSSTGVPSVDMMMMWAERCKDWSCYDCEPRMIWPRCPPSRNLSLLHIPPSSCLCYTLPPFLYQSLFAILHSRGCCFKKWTAFRFHACLVEAFTCFTAACEPPSPFF